MDNGERRYALCADLTAPRAQVQWHFPFSIFDFPLCGRFANGKNYHDTGHLLKRRQKPALRGPVPDFPAGRLPRCAVQVTEHGAQFVHHGGRQGDGPRTGRAGRGGGHRARCAHEPDFAQADKRRWLAGHHHGRGAGKPHRAGVLGPQKGAFAHYQGRI